MQKFKLIDFLTAFIYSKHKTVSFLSTKIETTLMVTADIDLVIEITLVHMQPIFSVNYRRLTLELLQTYYFHEQVYARYGDHSSFIHKHICRARPITGRSQGIQPYQFRDSP